jgi:hypothetical protein
LELRVSEEVHRAWLVARAFKEVRDSAEKMEPMEHRVLRDFKDSRDIRDHKDSRVHKVLLEFKVLKVY